MPLNKLIVKNYKSLKDFSLDTKPFMVFIGPNNAGKSNILDCLRFLSEFAKRGDERRNAWIERGGFEQIVFNGEINQTISFELQGTIRVEDGERSYRYFVELEGSRWGSCLNRHETFSLIRKIHPRSYRALTEDTEQKLLEFPGEKDMAIVRDETGKQTGGFGTVRETLYLPFFDDIDHYPILGHFAKEVQNWSFFNLLPPLMREPLPVKRTLQLQSFGENLSVILHTLQSESPKRFKEIEEILKKAVGEVEELTTGLTEHAQGKTYIRIREQNLRIPISVWAMSDGTLRILGYLATLYSPIPLPLACFEEPENYVHPRLLELIVDLIKTASERTQVLVTTHSPYFVDFLQPEDLFIVEKKEGQTTVRKAEDKKGIKEALKTLGLGEMWYSGGLGGVP